MMTFTLHVTVTYICMGPRVGFSQSQKSWTHFLAGRVPHRQLLTMISSTVSTYLKLKLWAALPSAALIRILIVRWHAYVCIYTALLYPICQVIRYRKVALSTPNLGGRQAWSFETYRAGRQAMGSTMISTCPFVLPLQGSVISWLLSSKKKSMSRYGEKKKVG